MSISEMHKILFLIMFGMVMPVAAVAQSSDWRKPLQSDLLIDLELRKKDPELYLKANADFNGDGMEDSAFLLINDKEDKMGLFVSLSAQHDGPPLLLETLQKKDIMNMGIRVATPDKYKTACGKGYWACEKGEPAVLELMLPAIDFFMFESANSYFIWEKKTSKFKRIWISD